MEDSDFYNNLRMLDKHLLKYPKHCLLLFKPFDNVKTIDLSNYEDFINCITHLQKYHSDRYFTDSARYKIDLTQSGEYHSIIRQMNYLYFVEFEVKNNIVYITVNMLNPPICRYHETFTVEFKQEKVLMKEAPIKRKGTKYMYTLEFKVNDLSIIGDITQTEVLITLENYITCKLCGEIRKYSDGTAMYKFGWCCFKCNLRRRLPCCNKSCVYSETMDYLPKLQKHFHLFCPFQYPSTCYICHNKFRQTFHLHYQKDHQDIIYEIGQDIRIQATPGRYCLLRWSTDTFLLMRYHLDSEELFLAIRSPWKHINMDAYIKYTCSVTVSTYEQTETFQLYPLVYEYDDWKLSVGKWLFKKWNTDIEFTVFVEIQRMPD